jgi:hypothetical protein
MNNFMIYHQQPSLGWINEAITAGASIFSSVVGSKNQKKAMQSAEKQAQLQLQAQREQAASTERLMKLGLIGGGIILAGTLVVILVKKSG